MGGRTWHVASGGWDGGGRGCWSRWGRACRCHWRLLRPYLPQLFWAGNGILTTPADLQPRESQGLALQPRKGREGSGAAVTPRLSRLTELGLVSNSERSAWEQKVKRLSSGYFWAYACYCNINNGWGRRWECSTGNRKRHPCQHRKKVEIQSPVGGWSPKSSAIHLHSTAKIRDKKHLINYSAKTADFFCNSRLEEKKFHFLAIACSLDRTSNKKNLKKSTFRFY